MGRSPAGPPPGLCGSCTHARRTGNRRGSVFFLCGRSATDARYRRYPPLPVLACPGFEPRQEAAEGRDRDGGESGSRGGGEVAGRRAGRGEP